MGIGKRSCRVRRDKKIFREDDRSWEKKLSWHTAFGEINLCERVFPKQGRLIRPFSDIRGVRCRGYSLPLQRRITDSGADVPFGKVPEKIREHYGISVPSASVRCITEKHAEKMRYGEIPVGGIPGTDGAEYMIAETDVGDGAPRVREQAERVFGERGSFLIDFYHLCGYLSEASEVCSRRNSAAFFNARKQPAEDGRMTEIPRQIGAHTEPASVSDKNAPVRCCIRYITDRAGQFGYKEAEEAASALSALPDFYVREISADDLDFQQSPIRDRITLPAYRQDSVTLRFVTPVKLICRTAITEENFSFPVLIACILGRLKDLNKDLNPAADIRKIWELERTISDRLYDIARNVEIVGNTLHRGGLKVYSARQRKYVYLDGLMGEIRFSGPIYLFYPLLRAAEIVHIGKKTAYGNGRVEVNQN